MSSSSTSRTLAHPNPTNYDPSPTAGTSKRSRFSSSDDEYSICSEDNQEPPHGAQNTQEDALEPEELLGQVDLFHT
eukprot:11606913-Heterocapsa_arctica.AAC.1